MSALWRSLCQDDDETLQCSKDSKEKRKRDTDGERAASATDVPQRSSAAPSGSNNSSKQQQTKDHTTWIKRLRAVLSPIRDELEQRVEAVVHTGCSGTGSPTIALKDSPCCL